ncbi:MAG: hypothetical protein KDB05_13440 [Planctomycetales bacterium]|nr:hypothetical protein [Planctomycetales bacterium]
MRRTAKTGCCGALMLCVALIAANDSQAEMKAPATIVSPQVNSVVGRVTEVVYETTQPGVPLVLVAAEEENSEWWVQPIHKSSVPGRRSIAAYFGNSQTPQGKPFQVMVMMAPDERTAEIMAKQQVFTQLPKGLVTSKPVRVLRKFEPTTTAEKTTTVTASAGIVPVAAQILRLENRAPVLRRQEVHGKLAGPLAPVILVRAATDNMWWVQQEVQRDAGGEFTAIVHFGNEKTPAGTEFHMVALTPRSTSEAAAFKVGDSIKDLPEDVVVSSQMTFVLRADDVTGAE